MMYGKWLKTFFERVWHDGDLTAANRAIDEKVADDCIVVGMPIGKDIAREGFRAIRKQFHDAFERVELEIHEVLEVGNKGSYRGLVHDWHNGTRHPVVVGGMATLRDGRIVEAWNQIDFLALVTQFGRATGDAAPATLTHLAAQRAKAPVTAR